MQPNISTEKIYTYHKLSQEVQILRTDIEFLISRMSSQQLAHSQLVGIIEDIKNILAGRPPLNNPVCTLHGMPVEDTLKNYFSNLYISRYY